MSGRLDVLESWLSAVNSPAIEIILACDLAGQNCSTELQEMLKGFPTHNIHLYSNVFGSPGLARNLGLKKATGDWIAFWDSDDTPSWQKILQVLSESHDSEVVIGAFEKLNEVDNSKEPVYFKRIDPQSVEASLVSNPGLWRFLFRREVVSGLKFNKFRMAEDQLFLLSVNFFNRKVRVVNELFYTYHWGGTGHLVNNKLAIADLICSIESIVSQIKGHTLNPDSFVLRLMAKQVISALRYGDYRTRLSALELIILMPGRLRIPVAVKFFQLFAKEFIRGLFLSR
jgi:glycosyltransferase involved in cell wall biosynthesis